MSALAKEVESEIRRTMASMPFAAGKDGAASIVVAKPKGSLTQDDVVMALHALRRTLESVAEEYNERGKKLMEHAALSRSFGDFLASVLADAAERKR